MAAQPVAIPSFANSYISHGWKLCHVPEGTKGATTAKWNVIENALKEAPQTGGVGLLHSYSGTCAIDIDDFGVAKTWLAEHGIDLDQLLDASDAVQIQSGRPGSAKLIYSLPFPLPSKRVMVDRKTILEFRCATSNQLSVHDVLPPSRHPNGNTYQWAGRGDWRRTPLLPTSLTTLWQSLIDDDSRRNIEVKDSTPTSIEEVTGALFSIDPNCDRKTWVEVGMGLAEMDTDLFEAWNTWSEGSVDKYPGLHEMKAQWKSFKPVKQGITVASVFHHAIKHGWKRPIPDVSSLFRAVESAPGMEIKDIVDQVSATAKVPVCNTALFPNVLVRRADEVSREVGCDAVVPLIAGLCAVSAAIDKRVELVINPTWRVPPNIWCMTIGEPADKKTPGSRPMFGPLRKLEAEDKTRFELEMLKWKGIEARHAGDMKSFRDWQQSPEAQFPNAVPPAVTPLPPMPADLRLVINDATSQKMVSMAELRPRGFLLYLDEMNRWLTKLSDPKNGDDRGSWIQGYETGPYTMDRMGSGSIKVENLAMSLYGNCQPAVFVKTLEGASTDGIIQRFLPVVLNPGKNEMWQEALPDFMSVAGEYEQLIRRCYGSPVFSYTFSPGGMDKFRAFSQWCLTLRHGERYVNRSATYQTALGKMEGNCARLILLFHLIDDPYSLQVSGEIADRAIEAFKQFFVPSLRFTYLTVGQQKDPMAEDMLNLIVQWASVKPTVSMADLRRALRAEGASRPIPTVQDQMIRIYMDDFASLGYVSMFQDHPRFPVWSINPAVADLFAEERRKIIKYKQEVIEKIGQDMTEAGKPPSKPMPKAVGL